MKTQKVTKSSKFTQASPNDNEYRDYQNIGLTLLPVASVDDGTNQNVERISYVEGHCHNVNQSSELLLKSYEGFKTQESMHEIQRFSPVERNANRFPQEIEMCNCSANPVYAAKTRFGEQCKSDQTVTLNRSFTSLPKLESSLSQVSLDRKAGKYPSQQRSKHTYVCEQNQRILRELEKTASLRRMQSPEIINIHRGPFYEGHGVENCSIKDFKCDDHGFRRGHSVRTVGSRASIIQAGHPKRRPAGDGMDAEMDDPELMFEMTPGHHLGDCQCACDHVVYSPTTYTTCLQIVGPAEIEILSISNCHGFDDKDLHLRLNVNRVPFYAPMISGNVSLACDLDDKAEISLKGSPVVLNRHGKPADTDNKGLCKLPEKYLYEHSDPTVRDNFQSICPTSSSFHKITGAAPHLTAVDLLSVMPRRKNFKMELLRVGDKSVCK